MKKIKKLLIGLGGIVVLGGSYILLSNKAPKKYSIEWIKNLTDNEWEIERDFVQKEFWNQSYDDETRTWYKTILDLFDKVKSDRDWESFKPQGIAYHREHGYNLYKP